MPSAEKRKLSEICRSDPELKINETIKVKLFEHQKVGIKFLYDNFKSKNGCILADDMGLGKTCQISVLIISLMQMDLLRRSIIVVPATLI